MLMRINHCNKGGECLKNQLRISNERTINMKVCMKIYTSFCIPTVKMKKMLIQGCSGLDLTLICV